MNIVAAVTTMIVALKIQVELHERSVGRASTHLVRDNKRTKEQETREQKNKRTREQEREQDNKTTKEQDN